MNIAIAMFCGKHKFSLLFPMAIGLIMWTGALTPFMLLSFFIIYKIANRSIFLANGIFYLVTNFGCWLLMYPLTFEGFINCYWLAIPFAFRALAVSWILNTLLEKAYNTRENLQLLRVE